MASKIEVHVKVNGANIPNSPFVLSVNPLTFKPLRFIAAPAPLPPIAALPSVTTATAALLLPPSDPASPTVLRKEPLPEEQQKLPAAKSDAAEISGGGLTASRPPDATDATYGVSFHQLPTDREAHWKLKVGKLRSGTVGIMVVSDAMEVAGVDAPPGTSGAKSDRDDVDYVKPKKLQLPVGTRVTARYKGKERWFPGEIIRLNDGSESYNIKYDDGDIEFGVKRDLIRIAPRIYGWGTRVEEPKEEDGDDLVGTITVAGNTVCLQ